MKKLFGKCGVLTLRDYEEARGGARSTRPGKRREFCSGVQKGNGSRSSRSPDISRNRP